MRFLRILITHTDNCTMWYPHELHWQNKKNKGTYCVFNASNEGWLFILPCRTEESECFFNDAVS
jgi:hypothetical protein